MPARPLRALPSDAVDEAALAEALASAAFWDVVEEEELEKGSPVFSLVEVVNGFPSASLSLPFFLFACVPPTAPPTTAPTMTIATIAMIITPFVVRQNGLRTARGDVCRGDAPVPAAPAPPAPTPCPLEDGAALFRYSLEA